MAAFVSIERRCFYMKWKTLAAGVLAGLAVES